MALLDAYAKDCVAFAICGDDCDVLIDIYNCLADGMEIFSGRCVLAFLNMLHDANGEHLHDYIMKNLTTEQYEYVLHHSSIDHDTWYLIFEPIAV